MIVIPMAGDSRRFREAGYAQPKYMLPLWGRPVFDHAVRSFSHRFATDRFVFVARGGQAVADFVSARCEALGIAHLHIAMLDAPTTGQADTVARGVRTAGFAEDEPLTIFNIDTFRPSFVYPKEFSLDQVDGYLETFIGTGKNWSNVVPSTAGDHRVALTAEKQEISEYCCTGLYWFRRARDFLAETDRAMSGLAAGSESYVAPLYNNLIADGRDVRFTIVAKKDVVFCGVPAEYEALLASSIGLA